MKADKIDDLQIDYGSYVDVLYAFARAVVKLNDKAIDGEEPKLMKKRFESLAPAFIILCGGDVDIPPKEKPKPKPKTVLQVNLQTKDGWGMCPTCGKKCIRVHENTILVNYPMFCKACKREYMVTWKMKP